ncbi:hypothetical protein EDB83DRAFT_2322296 [Lactarius deliciosus]|nr:hypothetical protein EDB83DRAFT_2322296 [Lactarius deliciosus]
MTEGGRERLAREYWQIAHARRSGHFSAGNHVPKKEGAKKSYYGARKREGAVNASAGRPWALLCDAWGGGGGSLSCAPFRANRLRGKGTVAPSRPRSLIAACPCTTPFRANGVARTWGKVHSFRANGAARTRGKEGARGDGERGGVARSLSARTWRGHGGRTRRCGCEGGEGKGGQHALICPPFLRAKGQRRRKGEGVGGRLPLCAPYWRALGVAVNAGKGKGGKGKGVSLPSCVTFSTRMRWAWGAGGGGVLEENVPATYAYVAGTFCFRHGVWTGPLPFPPNLSPILYKDPSSPPAPLAHPIYVEKGTQESRLTPPSPASRAALFASRGAHEESERTKARRHFPHVPAVPFAWKGRMQGHAAAPSLHPWPPLPLSAAPFAGKGALRHAVRLPVSSAPSCSLFAPHSHRRGAHEGTSVPPSSLTGPFPFARSECARGGAHEGTRPPALPLPVPPCTRGRSARDLLVASDLSSSPLAAPPVRAERGRAQHVTPDPTLPLFARRRGARRAPPLLFALSPAFPLPSCPRHPVRAGAERERATPPLSPSPPAPSFPLVRAAPFARKECTRAHRPPLPFPRKGCTRAHRSPSLIPLRPLPFPHVRATPFARNGVVQGQAAMRLRGREGATVPFPRSLFARKGAHESEPPPPPHASHRRAHGLPALALTVPSRFRAP